jgi:hypothetical protein
MKVTKSKIITYSLNELSEEQFVFIRELVEKYAHNNKISSEQAELLAHLKPIMPDADTKNLVKKPAEKTETPKSLFEDKAADNKTKLEKIHELLSETSFDGIMCPQRILEDELLEKDNDGCVEFIYGKQNQLKISQWLKKDDYVNENCDADSYFWLNAECVRMIYDMIKTRGESARGFRCSNVDRIGDIRHIQAYKDSQGKLSDKKYMSLIYNRTHDTITIEKEGEDISLTPSETISLYYFINYHMHKGE